MLAQTSIHQLKRLIYVDDDSEYGTFVSIALRRLGHSVSYFSNPSDALRVLAMDPTKWDGVITDLHMLQADGTQLARLIAERYPRIRCVVITGDADSVQPELTDNKPPVYPKPGSIDELHQLISLVAWPQALGQQMLN